MKAYKLVAATLLNGKVVNKTRDYQTKERKQKKKDNNEEAQMLQHLRYYHYFYYYHLFVVPTSRLLYA